MRTKVGSTALAFAGLAIFGAASIAANVLSVNLPPLEGGLRSDDIARWRELPKLTGTDPWSYVWAVLFPVAALLGVEFVRCFTRLKAWVRYPVLGLAALVAAFSSYIHIVHVLLWYGQGVVIALIGPFAIDGLMILCTMQILSGESGDGETPRADTPAARDVVVPAPVVPERTDNQVVPAPVVPAPVVPERTDNQVVPAPVVPEPVVLTPTAPAPVVPERTDNQVVPTPRVPMDNQGGTTARRGPRPWDKDLARKLIADGLSDPDIAARVGVSAKTIRRYRTALKTEEGAA